MKAHNTKGRSSNKFSVKDDIKKDLEQAIENQQRELKDVKENLVCEYKGYVLEQTSYNWHYEIREPPSFLPDDEF